MLRQCKFYGVLDVIDTLTVGIYIYKVKAQLCMQFWYTPVGVSMVKYV